MSTEIENTKLEFPLHTFLYAEVDRSGARGNRLELSSRCSRDLVLLNDQQGSVKSQSPRRFILNDNDLLGHPRDVTSLCALVDSFAKVG